MLFYRWQRKMLMDKAGEGGDGGSGGGGAGQGGEGDKSESAKALADLKSANEALMKRLEALEGKNKTPPAGDPDDLATKAAKDRLAKEKENANYKRLEAAITFSKSGSEWVKNNANLLPKSIEGIFAQAEKENYANAIEKDSAIKAGLISEFFAVQANLDLLTETQKIALAEFKALTKNDKQERAHDFYNSIFEPTFENLKRVEKAKQLNKGQGDNSDSHNNYKKKLLEMSSKKHLGAKNA